MLIYFIWFVTLIITLVFLYFHLCPPKLNKLNLNPINVKNIIQELSTIVKEWREEDCNKLKSENYFKNHLLISKNIDTTIEELVDLFLRDYLLNWYTAWPLNDDKAVTCLIKNEIWLILSRLLVMFADFDDITFFSKDLIIVIHSHFKRISSTLERKHSYSLYGHLENSDKEREYLRKLSNLIFKLLLPSRYYSIDMLVDLLQEIFAIHVLQNFINTITDPDFINQKFIEYILFYRAENEKCQKTYTYAETYEDFINLINKCQNVQELKNIQYDIVCEIMEASALNNYKQERSDKESKTATSSLPNVKGSLLLNRDLKRYINQLRFAKNLCSKKIHLLSNYTLSSISSSSTSSSSSSSSFIHPPSKKILSFNQIIITDNNRIYFKKFLQDTIGSRTSSQDCNSKYLLLLWEEIEIMKTRSNINPYKIANEILKHSYFLNSVNSFIKLRKDIRNGMESYVRGNTGPESFYEVQSLVYEVLKDRYYPLFIVSKEYEFMIKSRKDTSLLNLEVKDCNNSLSTKKEKDDEDDDEEEDVILNDDERYPISSATQPINEHIAIAKSKLKALKQKIVDKGRAMDGIKECSDLTITYSDYNRISILGKEVVDLQEKIYQLDNYIKWSEQWVCHFGEWKAELHNIEIDSKKQLESPSAVVIIHHNQNTLDSPGFGGWIVCRTISEFINLKRKCVRICPHLKKIELLRLKNVSSSNVNLIKKASENLQLFLNELFKAEQCQKSEEVYLFFCPLLKSLQPSSSKSMTNNRWNLPFASFFGFNNLSSEPSNQLEALEEPRDELSDPLFNLQDELENKDDNIAEPLYALLIEIFGIKGAIGFFRKTLITFVQIVGEKTINKELRETVSWICSESMLSYYLSCLKEIIWPNGKLAEARPQNTEAVKKQNQFKAKQLILDNIPQILNHLFGHQNCRKGLIKIFEYIQEPNLNKQLVYDIIETFLIQFIYNSNQLK